MDSRNSTSEIDDDVEESMIAKVSTNTSDFALKMINISTNNVLDKMTKLVIFRNLFVVSFAFMLIFSAFFSVSNLQSSLNKEDGLGTSGMACVYAAMVLSSLFITPLTLARFSQKWVMIVSMITYIAYVSAGFYPAWSTIIPASLILGMGAAHNLLAVQAYITDIAKRYAHITQTNVQDRVYLFLGIFYAVLYTSNIWGNLFSSLVFQRTAINNTDKDTSALCGSNFCSYKEMNDSIITPPPLRQVYIYTGLCAGMCALALLLVLLFLTDTSSGGQHISSICKKLRQVTIQIFTSRNQMLLTFATFFGGLAGGFTAGDFTSAYISCPYGIENVGFVMVTFGVSQSVFCALFGKLSQYTGHIPIYIFGFLAQLSAYITLLLWTPNSSEYAVVYVIAALFGIGGAINSPLVSGAAHFWLAMPAYVIDIAKRYAYITDTVIQDRVYIFTGFCCGITSLIFLLSNICSGSNKSSTFCKLIRKVAVHLMRSRDQQLLIVSSVFSGMAMGFIVGDFTSAYISCPFRIENVGLAMLTFGVSQSLFSAGFGKLNQYTGHLAIYTLGSVTLTSVYVALLLWNPLPTQYAVVYVLAVLIGLAGAANEPVIAALHNLYFDKTRDVALSSFRLMCSIGWALSFGYSSWLCSQYNLYILIGLLVLSLINLVVLHIKHKRAKTKYG